MSSESRRLRLTSRCLPPRVFLLLLIALTSCRKELNTAPVIFVFVVLQYVLHVRAVRAVVPKLPQITERSLRNGYPIGPLINTINTTYKRKKERCVNFKIILEPFARQKTSADVPDLFHASRIPLATWRCTSLYRRRSPARLNALWPRRGGSSCDAREDQFEAARTCGNVSRRRLQWKITAFVGLSRNYTGFRRETKDRTDQLYRRGDKSISDYFTVCHVVGAVEDLGRFARRQTTTAVYRHRLHLQEVLASELEILQFIARLVLEENARTYEKKICKHFCFLENLSTTRTHFRNRLMIYQDRIVCWPVDESAPEHLVERYRYVRCRFDPSQVNA